MLIDKLCHIHDHIQSILYNNNNNVFHQDFWPGEFSMDVASTMARYQLIYFIWEYLRLEKYQNEDFLTK